MSSHDQSSPQPKAQASARSPQSPGQMNPQLLVFGGNKGGVGRSVISTLTSLSLAKMGYQTLLIDLNLGASNIHTLLGIMQIPNNFERWVLDPKVEFESICTATSHSRLSLISSAGSILNIGDIAPDRLKQLIRDALNMEVDYVVIDLGSSLHPHHLDLLNMASQSFCITTPDPLSIQNTYALYKAVLMRRMEACLKERPWLKKLFKRVAITQDGERSTPMGEILGMLRELDLDVHREAKSQLQSLRLTLVINQALSDDESQVVGTLSKICQKSLALTLTHSLTLPEEPKIRGLVRKLKSLSTLDSELPISVQLNKWVNQWLLTQPYAALQEGALDHIGKPSLLGHRGKASLALPSRESGLSQLQPNPGYAAESTLLGAPQLFLATQQNTNTPSPDPIESKLAGMTLSDVEAYPEAKDLLEMRRLVSSQARSSMPDVAHQSDAQSFHQSPHDVSQVMNQGEYPEQPPFDDSQSESFIEPEPIGSIMMEDPPPT